MTSVESVLALGSNLGDREDNLRKALSAIERRMELLGVSSVYETEPMYREDQGKFLNCVVVVETELEPEPLLAWLKVTERKVGREQDARNAPRVIDLDILFYGDRFVLSSSLEIPHPRIAERAFVLVPLNDVRPKLVHPVLKKSVAQMLAELKATKGVVKRPGLLAGFSSSQPRRRGRPAASPSRRES